MMQRRSPVSIRRVDLKEVSPLRHILLQLHDTTLSVPVGIHHRLRPLPREVAMLG